MIPLLRGMHPHRILFPVLPLFLVAACTTPAPKAITVYHSTKRELGMKVNGVATSWTITPSARPDAFAAPCVHDSAVLELTGAQEPIRYVLQVGDTIDFVILLGADSAFTRLIGVPWVPPARFSKAYIDAHRWQWSVEIPEVQELMLTAIALTPSGRADSNMVAHEGPYYRDMMAHFAPFAKSEVVERLEGALHANPFLYTVLKEDANAFHFDGERLVQDSVYDRLTGDNENIVRAHLPPLEAFAKASGFRAFFAAHHAYYDSLCTATRDAMPVDAMWRWLEEHGESHYDNYRITISPLTEGSHSTMRFEDNGFSQTVMFICPAFTDPGWSPGLTEGHNSRVVFTEIDHNYVNPISDRHVEAIGEAMGDRRKWAAPGITDGYANAYAVFNEYMTFGVYLLYAQEKLSAADFKELRGRTVRLMEKRRGFIRFGAFQEALEKAYAASADKKIAGLYPSVLEACTGM